MTYGNLDVGGAFDGASAQGGYPGAMKRMADALSARSRQTYVNPTDIANLYVSAGDKDRAFEWLENLSGDPEQGYLAEGMHDALITNLAQLSGLKRVIARGSVLRFKGTNTPLRPAGQSRELRGVPQGDVLPVQEDAGGVRERPGTIRQGHRGSPQVARDRLEPRGPLQAAFEYHHIFLPWIMQDPAFPWRSDPRWQEFERRLNFPQS